MVVVVGFGLLVVCVSADIDDVTVGHPSLVAVDGVIDVDDNVIMGDYVVDVEGCHCHQDDINR